ncbi:MAG: MliC family protein [Longimonas sp.]|uniref:MliC family protein n=1 Tax=Longimonas sp. TaxID=2039626 RepID=UPI0033607E07
MTLRIALVLIGVLLATAGWMQCSESTQNAEATTFDTPRMYTCTIDMSFAVTREADDRVHLHLPGETRTATLVESASGSRYDGPSVSYWSHEDEARLVVDGTSYDSCAKRTAEGPWADAEDAGVDVRAAGNEPGWMVTLTHGDSLTALLNYGMTEHAGPAPDPQSINGSTRYRFTVDGAPATLTVEPTPCHDSMRGDIFPATATLIHEELSYPGCAWVFD